MKETFGQNLVLIGKVLLFFQGIIMIHILFKTLSEIISFKKDKGLEYIKNFIRYGEYS